MASRQLSRDALFVEVFGERSFCAEEVARLMRVSRARVMELAGEPEDPLPLRLFPGAVKGAFAMRCELMEWLERNWSLVAERGQAGGGAQCAEA